MWRRYEAWRHGILPKPGAYGDQPRTLLLAFSVLERVERRAEHHHARDRAVFLIKHLRGSV